MLVQLQSHCDGLEADALGTSFQAETSNRQAIHRMFARQDPSINEDVVQLMPKGDRSPKRTRPCTGDRISSNFQTNS